MGVTTVDKRTFLGGLDRDSDKKLVKDNDYSYALNIRNLSSEDGSVGVIENVKGNTNVSYTFPNINLGQVQISYFYLLPSASSYTDSLLLSLGGTTYVSGSAFSLGSSADISTPANIQTLFNTFVTNFNAMFSGSPYNITVSVVGSHVTIGGVTLPALKFEGENLGEEFALSSISGKGKIDIEQYAKPSQSVTTTYKCIGAYEDTKDDKVYYYVTSVAPKDSFYSHILEYDLRTDSLNTVFRDTGKANTSVFKWKPYFLITDINKIGDVLYWTQDRYGEPKSINVRKSKNTFTSFNTSGAAGTYTPLSDYYPYRFVNPNIASKKKQEYIEVIKRYPLEKPSYSYSNDPNYKKNNVFGFSWQFRYRYHYYDKEVSPWSPISDIQSPANLALNNYIENYNSQNQQNKIEVLVKNSVGTVEFIEVCARKCKDLGNVPFGNRGEFFSIAKIDNNFSAFDTNPNSTQTVTFYNDKVYTFIDATDANKLFDAVPKKAKTQTVIDDNRLAYGNYFEGFDLPDLNISITPKYLQQGEGLTDTKYPFFTTKLDSDSIVGSYDLDTGGTSTQDEFSDLNRDFYNSTNDVPLTPGSWPGTAGSPPSTTHPLIDGNASNKLIDLPNSTPSTTAYIKDAVGNDVEMELSTHTVKRSLEAWSDFSQYQESYSSVPFAFENFGPLASTTLNLQELATEANALVGIGAGTGYYTGSTAGSKDNFAKIRFVFNYGNYIYQNGATIDIDLKFKFRVRQEAIDAGSAGHDARHTGEREGNFSLSVFCPTNLTDLDQQFAHVADQMAAALPFYNDPNNDKTNDGQQAWRKRPIVDTNKNLLIFEWVAPYNNKYDGNLYQSGTSGYDYRLVTSEKGFGFFINAQTQNNIDDSALNAGNTATLKYRGGAANGKNSSFKSGAFHSFGLIYYDETGRCSTVALDDNSQTYVKFPTERIMPNDALNPIGQSDPYGKAVIQWQISHDPPSWAKYYRWAYARNTSVDDFIQFIAKDVKINTTLGTDKRIFLSLNSLKGKNDSYKEKNNPLIDYEYVEGDRIRFLQHPNGSFFNQYIDVRITGYDYYDSDGSDPDVPIGTSSDNVKGFFIDFEQIDIPGFRKLDVTNNISIFKDCTFEIYRPKKEADKENLIYYEFGPLYRTTLDKNTNNVVHQNHYGSFDFGDVYYKPRVMLDNNSNQVQRFVESYFLNDFYPTNHFNIGRANAYSPFAKEERKKVSITYSEPFQPDVNYNGLSTFNSALVNFRTYNRIDGSIQKIFARDTDLIMIQEDKTHRIMVNKDIIVDAAGDSNVGLSSNVLSKTSTPYWGHYGISKNPESFVNNGNVLYWVDIKRGAVLRLSRDGFTVISNANMIDYFNDKSTLYNSYDAEHGFYTTTEDEDTGQGIKFRILGGFNPKHNEYVITFPQIEIVGNAYNNISNNWNSSGWNWNVDNFSNTVSVTGETIAWSEGSNRWMSFMSFKPDMYAKINRQFISFDNGQLYTHDDNSSYTNFYGTVNNTELTVPFNGDPSSVKMYKAISVEGNQALSISSGTTNESSDTAYDVTLTTNLSGSSIDRNNFDEREGIQYVQIPFATSGSQGGEYFGVGTCTTSSSSATVTGYNNLTNFTDLNLLIGDIIYYNASGTNTAVGTIQSINSDTSITLTSNATVTLGGTGTFLYVIRSGFAEGDRLKGNYMTAKLSKQSQEKLEIYAVNAVVSKSELSNR